MAKRAGKKRDEKPRRNRGEAAKTKEVWRCDETPWREPEERLGTVYRPSSSLSFEPKIRLVFVSLPFLLFFHFLFLRVSSLETRRELIFIGETRNFFFFSFFNFFELRFIIIIKI